jgi:cell division protein ZapA
MMDDTLLIHVQIGGFRMPLRIPRSDEEVYRKAQKMVEEYTETYQKRYNQRSYEEVLILVAYQLATLIARQQLSDDTGPVESTLKDLEAEIEKALRME